jgi:hypothetical protein
MQTPATDVNGGESRLQTFVRRRLGWADWGQIAVALTALAACCRGEGHPFRWLAAALVLPVVRFLSRVEFRQIVLAFLQRQWLLLGAYAAGGARTPWPGALVFAVVPSLLLFLSNDRSPDTGDTWPVIPTACNLITAGSWSLDAYVAQAPSRYALAENGSLPYCTLRRPGGVYSSYPAGMVPFALPATATARLLGANLAEPKVQKHLEKWVASWVSSLAVGLFFLTALRLAAPLPALVTTGLLAGGSALFSSCGQNLWQHDGVIFWSLLALWVEFQQPWRDRLGGVVLQGLACGMMPACRLSSALFFVPFGLWVLLRSPRRGVLVVATAALVYAPWAFLYGSIYGDLFGPSTGQLGGGNWSWNLADKLAAILVSPSHGLLVYQPWLLLAAGCYLPKSGGRDAPAAWPWFCLVVIAAQVVLVASWNCWWGGYCWGSRLLADVIPPGALLCVRAVAALWTRTAGRVLLAGLAIVAFALHAVANYGHADYWHTHVQTDRHPEMLWSWSRAPFFYPFQRYSRSANGLQDQLK